MTTPAAPQTNADAVRALNDAFRKTATSGIVFTEALAARGLPKMLQILRQVRDHSDFPAGNDPYQEHDFGSFAHGGEKLFWKIDYYNLDMDAGSEDPSDPAQTTRIMTIMLASDY